MKTILRLIAILVMLPVLSIGVFPNFASGQTEISDWHDLNDIRNSLDGDYILMNDIDEQTDGYADYNSGEGWDPIGPFTGSLNGDGNTISGLFIDRDGGVIGFFGDLEDAVVSDLGLVNADVTSTGNATGILAGRLSGSTNISNFHVTGSVATTGDFLIGGVAGQAVDQTTISDSWSSADVTAAATNNVGGIVGVLLNSAGIMRSFATGNVSSEGDNVGGLAGHLQNNSTIENSYAHGEVDGGVRVGGLVGRMAGNSISHAYSTGAVSSSGAIGGLIAAHADGDVVASYWDTESSGQSSSAEGVGLTTAEMTSTAAYINMSEFDFEETWLLTESYPALTWEDVEAISPPEVFEGGSGTAEDPYQIATLEQLWEMGNYLDSHFILISDIDASDTETWNDDQGWESIGTFGDPFTGGLNGDGHTINGLFIDREGSFIGFFGVLEDAVISDLGLVEADVTSTGNATGILAGRLSGNTNISNFHATGSVETSGPNLIGGLTGQLTDEANINDSWSSADVTGGATNYVGGLVGVLLGSSGIQNSFVTGNVFSEGDNVGGLAGHLQDNATIVNSYAHGEVDGGVRVGGLVGHTLGESSISHTYSTGAVSGSGLVGGLIGVHAGDDVVASYWDTESSGLSDGVGDGVDEGATGLVTAEMTGTAAYSNMAEFDFDETWLLTESYPALSWEDVEAISPPVQPDVAVLDSPADGSEGITIPVTFQWEAADNAEAYNLQVGTDSVFTGLIVDTTGIDGTELVIEDDMLFEEMTTYYWRVQSTGIELNADWSDTWSFQTSEVTSIDMDADIPEVVTLEQNYPNPFNPTTAIKYGLPESQHVRLVVYDLLGRQVAILIDETRSAGFHIANWDATRAASGIYIYRLDTGSQSITRLMMLIK